MSHTEVAKPPRKRLQPKAGNGGSRRLASDERQRHIAEAAYFRALERGFSGGDELADWLAAEAEIDARRRDVA